MARTWAPSSGDDRPGSLLHASNPSPITMHRALEAVHSAVDHVTDGLAWLEEMTGLPPVVLFTVLALLVGAYYLISGVVAPSQIGSSPLEAADEPATSHYQAREMTVEQLGDFDGRDPSKPLFMAIKGQVYDVSSAKDFYGPGAPYSVFAGKDASRALAKMSFQAGDLTGDLEGLTDQELEVLKDWEVKFGGKYPKVGVVAVSSAAREAEHKVEEEPARQARAQITAPAEAEHKAEEEHSYAQVAATGEAEHEVKEEHHPKQEGEVNSSQSTGTEAKEHGEAGDWVSVKSERQVKQSKAGEAEQVTDVQAGGEHLKVAESEDGEAKPTAATESSTVAKQSSESAPESKLEDGDQSSRITRDVPVSAGERTESEDGNESSVVTRDIPVSGGNKADEPKREQGDADAMTKQQQNEADESRLSSSTLEQVLEPSKEQYVISKHGDKHSQDEKDFELVDKGKVPDAESLLSIRDSDYIKGLQDVKGL